MSIQFAKAKEKDFDQLCTLYRETIENMRSRGLRQWEWGAYPSEELLQDDIDGGILYRVDEDGELCAAFAVSGEMEDAYSRIAWQYGVKPVTMHRLAVKPGCFGSEMVERVLSFVKAEALRMGYDCLRLDVCDEDAHMLHLFRSQMLRDAGSVHFDNMGDACTCLEEPLSENCPMLPIPMTPAYRHGEMTPWGGDGLRRYYRMEIPDDRTGEALVLSAIHGLESKDETGATLTELIARNGSRLTGLPGGEAFPLLLKLLSAKDSLSVQVHPDDAYAKEHEGKLGKSEAWVILHAEKDASILYGIREGVTVEDMRLALEREEDIEPMIQRVPVNSGDVFYMPSGMVHAIGGGIVLYEIQQSSDVTYRLWDYNRTNAAGEKRPLHIKQALDVIDPSLRGQIAKLPTSDEHRRQQLLDVPAFTLDCVAVNGEYELASTPTFRILTALAGLLVSWEGDALEMEAGDTALLPANCPPVTLMGVGQALISGVGERK
ncbi:MAG: class I mannose-6-phosphate isomerase [Eubacteriales bacterium]|nr:class I mannose-6-phosphate isomerase [Eubacteriales bacterium]